MATWNAPGTGGTNHHPQNLMMLRKQQQQQQQNQQHHPGSASDSGLVAMLSSPGLRAAGGLDRSSPHPVTGSKRPFYAASMLDPLDESGDGEIADDGSTGGAGGYTEKKRRLSVEQVRSLEMSFEVENRLEPVRKMQLAQELGLQPRQVAVWFQNRRARWKTKQLERDYDILKAAYESIEEENRKLKAQLQKLTSDVDNIDDDALVKKVKKDDDEGEESGAGASPKVKHVAAIKSSGLEEETCTTPDSPTVVSSKFKESPSSDGYGSEVLDTLSPHAPGRATTATPGASIPPGALPSEGGGAILASSQAIKEEPVTFPYKLDEDDALRGLEEEDSYNCLFGVTEEQANWAWWEWS